MALDYFFNTFEEITTPTSIGVLPLNSSTYITLNDNSLRYLFADIVIYEDDEATVVPNTSYNLTRERFYTSKEASGSQKVIYFKIELVDAAYDGMELFITGLNFGTYTSNEILINEKFDAKFKTVKAIDGFKLSDGRITSQEKTSGVLITSGWHTIAEANASVSNYMPSSAELECISNGANRTGSNGCKVYATDSGATKNDKNTSIIVTGNSAANNLVVGGVTGYRLAKSSVVGAGFKVQAYVDVSVSVQLLIQLNQNVSRPGSKGFELVTPYLDDEAVNPGGQVILPDGVTPATFIEAYETVNNQEKDAEFKTLKLNDTAETAASIGAGVIKNNDVDGRPAYSDGSTWTDLALLTDVGSGVTTTNVTSDGVLPLTSANTNYIFDVSAGDRTNSIPSPGFLGQRINLIASGSNKAVVTGGGNIPTNGIYITENTSGATLEAINKGSGLEWKVGGEVSAIFTDTNRYLEMRSDGIMEDAYTYFIGVNGAATKEPIPLVPNLVNFTEIKSNYVSDIKRDNVFPATTDVTNYNLDTISGNAGNGSFSFNIPITLSQRSAGFMFHSNAFRDGDSFSLTHVIKGRY